MLQLVTASHETMHQLGHFSATAGGGDFFQGLGTIFGKAISAISTGGSKLIKAADQGVKASFQGMGEFSEKVAHSMADTTGTLISTGSHAIHNVETGTGTLFKDIFGGTGGAVLWGLVLTVMVYFVYTYISQRCNSKQTGPPSEDCSHGKY